MSTEKNPEKAKPETLQELRTLVLESEGITSEDESVCPKCRGGICKEGSFNYYCEDCGIDGLVKNDLIFDDIRGERVLKALGNDYAIDGMGNILKFGIMNEANFNGEYDLYEVKVIKGLDWKLNKSAKEQSEEDLQKIIKLLK